jgi:aminopeptidase YwaD
MARGIDRTRLWEHLRFLCEDIGPRLSGTPADESTVQYLAANFRSAGAEVTVQDYPCPGWEHEETRLALLGGGAPEALDAVAQTFTQGCDVEAKLAVVGTKHELEFRPDIEGTLLVVRGEAASELALDRNPGLLAIEERRPLAVIVVSTAENVSSKLIRDPFLRLPAAAVSASVGQRLVDSEGATARLQIRARRYDSTGHNVIAHLPGATAGRIVVGAHYDTAAGTPGATDDASGTAILLELCALFGASRRRALGLDFIAFGAEEYGRHVRALGSVEYFRRHRERALSAQAAVQVDTVGTRGGKPQVYAMGWAQERREEIVRLLSAFPRAVVQEGAVMGSDHVPFFLHGIPVVVFMNSYRELPIHTPADCLELMDPDELAHSGAAVTATVRHLAGVLG